MLQPQSLAAQMTIHWNREDQDVTNEQLLCDPYLTHVFLGSNKGHVRWICETDEFRTYLLIKSPKTAAENKEDQHVASEESGKVRQNPRPPRNRE